MLRALVAAFILTLYPGCQMNRSETQQQVLAEVFGEKIYRRDLEPGEEELKDLGIGYPGLAEAELRRRAQASKLTSKISSSILERLEQTLDLTATEAEIKEYLAAMSGMEDNPAMIPYAEASVKQWKLDRALYEKYGGVVIFQQSNPFEPVGAYRALFEENEKSGSFTIYDQTLREEFWSYYLREHPFQVPAAEVDFSVPWWKKLKE